MDSDLPGQGVLEAENLKSLDILGFSAHSPLRPWQTPQSLHH